MLSYLLAAMLGGLSINTQINPYRVEGDNLKEVLKNIEKFGPKDHFGISRHAVAAWEIRWSWKNGIRDPKVTLKLSLTHPAWDGNCAEWGRYMNELIAHEVNHLKFALETAKKVQSTIYSAKGLSEKELNFRLELLLNENRKLDLQYDLDTKNGRTEGVFLDIDAC